MLALFLCITYAISDEAHQLFVPGRGARLKDVLIDSFGAAIGIMFASIMHLKVKSRTNRSKQMPSKDTH